MARGASLAAVLSLCVASAIVVPWQASSAETLADALRSRGLVAVPQALGNLDRPITSYSVFDSDEEFPIAYYLDDGSGALHEPLFVSRYDKAANTWRSVAITDRAARPSTPTASGPPWASAPTWERPEVWARLAKVIAVPPEFTDVVYVYRNVTNGGAIEYRELGLGDLYARFGRHPLRWYLEPDALSRIFGR